MPDGPWYIQILNGSAHSGLSIATNERPRPSRIQIAALIVTGVVFVANGFLLAAAAANESWGALAIAIGVGPLTNGIILLLSLACIPIAKMKSGGASIGWYIGASIALPLLAIPADFGIIASWL